MQYSLSQINNSPSNNTLASPNYSLLNADNNIYQKALMGFANTNNNCPNSKQNYNVSYNSPLYANNKDFTQYKAPASTFTDHTPSGDQYNLGLIRMSLPYQNNNSRNYLQDNGITYGNSNLDSYVFKTETLATAGYDYSCSSDNDCKIVFGDNYTCNSNIYSWLDTQGIQPGKVCTFTVYPELMWTDQDGNQTYGRKFANEGGIGKACITDNDCGEGYKCNNKTDYFGKNYQQTGYCSQPYYCPNSSDTKFLGYPDGSGVPIAPKNDQNIIDGNPICYDTYDTCLHAMNAGQKCVQYNCRYCAVYPGYCPPVSNLRQDGSKQGSLLMSLPSQVDSGFVLPGGRGSNVSTSLGSQMQISSNTISDAANTSVSPLMMLQSWNGNTESTIAKQGALFVPGTENDKKSISAQAAFLFQGK